MAVMARFESNCKSWLKNSTPNLSATALAPATSSTNHGLSPILFRYAIATFLSAAGAAVGSAAAGAAVGSAAAGAAVGAAAGAGAGAAPPQAASSIVAIINTTSTMFSFRVDMTPPSGFGELR